MSIAWSSTKWIVSVARWLDFAKMMETFDRTKSRLSRDPTVQHGIVNGTPRAARAAVVRCSSSERSSRSARATRLPPGAKGNGLAAPDHRLRRGPRGFRLVVNEDEAVRVRQIFELYLEHQALIPRAGHRRARLVQQTLDDPKGQARGGKHFDKNSLFKMLTNVVYLGKVRYKTRGP